MNPAVWPQFHTTLLQEDSEGAGESPAESCQDSKGSRTPAEFEGLVW